MTTKDFKTIAEIIIMHQTHADPMDTNGLIREACTVLKRENPRFDPDKFTAYIKKAI
jgi:hypothetical protein